MIFLCFTHTLILSSSSSSSSTTQIHLGRTLEHRTAPIFSFCLWCSTRLHWANHQGFCRSCALQGLQICVCEVFVPTTSDIRVQKSSLLPFPCNHQQLCHPHRKSDNLVTYKSTWNVAMILKPPSNTLAPEPIIPRLLTEAK